MATVTYTRLSIEGDNTAIQLRDCMRLAADRGWEIAQEFEDNGISAAKRPAYEAMLDGIRAGRITRVVVSSTHWFTNTHGHATQLTPMSASVEPRVVAAR